MTRHFQNYIESCASSVGDKSVTPEVFRKWSALSSVAGALGKKAWYDFGQFKVYPNLFILLVAPPGRGKSVSLILPLYEIYGNLSVEPYTRKEDVPAKLDTFGLKDSPLYLLQDKVTPEELIRQMKKCGRVNLDLTTANKIHYESPLTLVTSEFGSLMNRNDKTLQMFLTDMWDAKDKYTYHTKTSGHDIIRGPCLNWIACATPEQFIENMPENARSQGLLPRIVPVFFDGEKTEDKLFYGKINSSIVYNLTATLAHIATLQGEFTVEDTFRDELQDYVSGGMAPRPTDPNMSEYNERRLAHWMKVAMCVSAACRDDMIITRGDWTYAQEMMLAAESDMPQALQFFGVRNAGRVALDVMDYIKASVALNKRNLLIKEVKREIMRKVANAAEIEATYRNMIESGMIKEEGKRVIAIG
jgi:hypothetical protein